MSGTVDIKRVLLAVMAAAALAVVLAVPQAQAASDCSAAGTDPTAAQYCPPTEPKEEEKEETKEECTEGSNNSGSSNGSGSENCEESTIPASSSSPPSETAASASEGGTLPFTGADLISLLAIAAAFIAVGLALQRLSKSGIEQG